MSIIIIDCHLHFRLFGNNTNILMQKKSYKDFKFNFLSLICFYSYSINLLLTPLESKSLKNKIKFLRKSSEIIKVDDEIYSGPIEFRLFICVRF
jgi:hypothetical protein